MTAFYHAAPAHSATIALAVVLSGFTPAIAAPPEDVSTQEVRVHVETIVDGLDHPWAVEVLPDGAFIMTERAGRLRIVRDGKVGDPIGGLPKVHARGQGGLMDVALAPDFASSRKIYLTASIPKSNGSGTALYSATLSGNERRLEDLKQLFAMNRFTSENIHYGSRIAIAPDGSLFIGIGDRGNRDRSQDWQDHAGSIIHINADGSIPSSKPDSGGSKGLPEIWSKGHRNPQGITFDSADGTLYTVEHGARGGDEINAPEPGRNYGWPIITYGRDYSGAEIGEGTAKEGLEQPLNYWDPSIAPGAIAIYRGRMFPEWDGDVLIAALKYQLLSRMQRDKSGKFVAEERMFNGEYGRIRDVIVAPDGALLIVTDEDDGRLLRVSRAARQEG